MSVTGGNGMSAVQRNSYLCTGAWVPYSTGLIYFLREIYICRYHTNNSMLYVIMCVYSYDINYVYIRAGMVFVHPVGTIFLLFYTGHQMTPLVLNPIFFHVYCTLM